jgi:hypothetical protein
VINLSGWWCKTHLDKYEFVNVQDYPVYYGNKKWLKPPTSYSNTYSLVTGTAPTFTKQKNIHSRSYAAYPFLQLGEQCNRGFQSAPTYNLQTILRVYRWPKPYPWFLAYVPQLWLNTPIVMVEISFINKLSNMWMMIPFLLLAIASQKVNGFVSGEI